MFGKTLNIIGCILYLVFFAWCIVGVWIYSFHALNLMVLMIETGLPPNKTTYDYNMLLIIFALAVYYLFISKTVSYVFWHIPFVKPMIVIGFVFFLGLTLTNNVLYYIVGHYEMGEHSLVLLSLGVLGFLSTRIFMSVIFYYYPAEWFASR